MSVCPKPQTPPPFIPRSCARLDCDFKLQSERPAVPDSLAELRPSRVNGFVNAVVHRDICCPPLSVTPSRLAPVRALPRLMWRLTRWANDAVDSRLRRRFHRECL